MARRLRSDLIYLDHAATTPLDPRVLAAMRPWLETEFANPSSRHRAGQRAARALDASRAEIARELGARPEGIVFTSGGTEANALAVLGAARARRRHGRHVLVGPTEHASVRECARKLASEGFEVGTLACGEAGALDLASAAKLLRDDTVLVAQMLVQNETGAIYPVRELARLVRARSRNAHVHVDAAQAVGKLDVSLAGLECDSLALCAHKIHGPKGVGALALASDQPIASLWDGGGQERGLRSGTEDVAGIVGLAAAVQLARAERERATELAIRARSIVAEGVGELRDACVLGAGDGVLPEHVPHVVAVLLPGAEAEVWAHHLDELDVAVGVGAACSARKTEPSPALLALCLSPAEARRVLRVSFARTTTLDDARGLVRALAALHTKLSRVGATR